MQSTINNTMYPPIAGRQLLRSTSCPEGLSNRSNNITHNEGPVLPLEPPSATPSSPVSSEQVITDARQNADNAKKFGIEPNKLGFIIKLCGLAAAGVLLGVAVAATILTAGAGVPLLALTSVAFVLAATDAACAFYHWRSEAGGGAGLPMQGDSVANVVYKLAQACGASESAAKLGSSVTSLIVSGAINMALAASGYIQPATVVGHAALVLTLIKSGANFIDGTGKRILTAVATAYNDPQFRHTVTRGLGGERNAAIAVG